MTIEPFVNIGQTTIIKTRGDQIDRGITVLAFVGL